MIRSRRRADDAAQMVAQARAEARSAAAEAGLLRSALSELPAGVFVVAADGRTCFRSATLVPGATPDVEALVLAELRGLLEKGAEEKILELHGPPRRRLVLAAKSLGGGGQVWTVHDVSERRQLDAVRRDFVANVSHELRTPIGALLALADAIAGEDDPAVTQRLVSRLSAEAERAAHMIESLLDLSRIEGDERPGADVLTVADVVKEATAAVREPGAIAGVSVSVDTEPGIRVVGHRAELVSALTNLLDNAIKYSERGANVEVAATRDGDAVRIVVRDEGVGIPRGDLDRIFERFYRVDRARSRQSGGAGLGLAIVRHVAENHGGAVTVDSTEGVGSTFALVLPEAR